jgi:uncharacterized protein (DUF427 family)
MAKTVQSTSGAQGRTAEWLPSPRWVRVRFNGTWVANSKRTMLLRQHGFLPVYYFPERDVRTDLLAPTDYTTLSPYKGEAGYWHLRVGERVARYAVWSYRSPKPGSPDTRGYYGFDWHSMDEWWEEEWRLHVHARDPFVRVDAMPSSRHVRVAVGGATVAETSRPVLLFETGLVTRYYVPPEDVRLDLLRPSSTYTMCPYKGRASYFHVAAADQLYEDAAWQYRSPLPNVREVTGHLCFWGEREDTTIVVDGIPLERLGTRESGEGGELLPPSRLFWPVPPPESMREVPLGRRQLDYARPNRRAEGPPDEVMDLAVERAGGRPDEWLNDPLSPR